MVDEGSFYYIQPISLFSKVLASRPDDIFDAQKLDRHLVLQTTFWKQWSNGISPFKVHSIYINLFPSLQAHFPEHII